MCEETRPLFGRKSPPYQRSVSAGRPTLPIARIKYNYIRLTEFAQEVSKREPLDTSADDDNARTARNRLNLVHFKGSTSSASPAACATVMARRGGRSVGKGSSLGSLPVLAQTKAFNECQQGTPWHGPMPHEVSRFMTSRSCSPAATRSATSFDETSMHGQMRVACDGGQVAAIFSAAVSSAESSTV